MRPTPWPSCAPIDEASPHPARAGRRQAHEDAVEAESDGGEELFEQELDRALERIVAMPNVGSIYFPLLDEVEVIPRTAKQQPADVLLANHVADAERRSLFQSHQCALEFRRKHLWSNEAMLSPPRIDLRDLRVSLRGELYLHRPARARSSSMI
jgi:hypothetical protein